MFLFFQLKIKYMSTISIEEYRNLMREKGVLKMPAGSHSTLIPNAEPKKERKKRAEPEHELQVLAINWFRLIYRDKVIFAIPNGGHRGKSEAGKLKAEGVLSGVSDLQCIDPSGDYSGFFAETKWGKNTLSENQVSFFEKAKERDFYTFTYYSLDEFINHVQGYFGV
jgi:hypothetical protein